jgi:SAM-dependent methyltransferase
MINNLKKFINNKDKQEEFIHYEQMAEFIKSLETKELGNYFGVNSVEPLQIPAYEYFIAQCSKYISNTNFKVLEIGAGFGRVTNEIVKFTDYLTVLDISPKALEINKTYNPTIHRVIVSNMENIPLEDHCMDLITIVTSLSYGHPTNVDREICRILKPGGTLIVLDSLNHNFIYVGNRLIKVLVGKKRLTTVLRIPRMSRINNLSYFFKESELKFFGKYFWFIKIFRYIFGIRIVSQISKFLDRFTPNRYSFHFVATFNGFRHNA